MITSTWHSCITTATATALTLGVFLGGCNSIATSSGTSAEGESCASEFDCMSGLKCVANTCTSGTGVMTADAGAQDTGTTDTGTDAKADAKSTGKLDASADAMTTPGKEAGPASEAGADSPTTTTITAAGPSALGQECTATSDCSAGLVCVPSTILGGVGICDLASFGVTPTGMTCTGECSTAADCYELPPEVGSIPSVKAQLDLPVVHTCDDVLTYLSGGYATNCTGATGPTPTTNGTAISVACFLYKTYCLTTSDSWTCEPSTSAGNGNRCVFTASCSQAVTDDFDGCPTETRFGTTLPAGESSVCSVTTGTGKCTGPAPVAATGCATSAECASMMLVTPDTGHVCTSTECICETSTGACYVKCTTNDDCAAGKVCSTTAPTTSLCVTAPGCVTNADCVASTHSASSVCATATGTCSTPCSNDHDCSHSSGATAVQSTLGLFSGDVCDLTTKTCVAAGCTNNADCVDQGIDGVNTFCVKPAATAAVATAVSSAITN